MRREKNIQEENNQEEKFMPPIKEIWLSNFLSFKRSEDRRAQRIKLTGLNILIGPNGSGKSNLIEALSFIRNSPQDIRKEILVGGGVGDWIWKGEKNTTVAQVEILFSKRIDGNYLVHGFSFREKGQKFTLELESIAFKEITRDIAISPLIYMADSQSLDIQLKNRTIEKNESFFIPGQSILSQLKDPVQYPEFHYISQVYDQIKIYREWTFGRNSPVRNPVKADQRNDHLEEDYSNLALVINRLRKYPEVRKRMVKELQILYEGLEDIEIYFEGGTVQIFLIEEKFSIPANRLSDGTLRYLVLITLLIDPEPPAIICIEEPELGLHPDIIPHIADLLIEASERTQLIVTTHSDILIDAMSRTPENVLVCEKEDGASIIKRLNEEDLRGWLEKYSLGELWNRGQIGGNRW